MPFTHANQGTGAQALSQLLVWRVPTNLSMVNLRSLTAYRRQPVTSQMQMLRQVSIKMCAPQDCTAQREQKASQSLPRLVTSI